MGGFLLLQNHHPNVDGVLKVFEVKGWKNFSKKSLGKYQLYNFSKQSVDWSNHYETGNSMIFVYGTPIYGEVDLRQIPKVLLNDIMSGKLNTSKLGGAYCLIIYHNSKIFILTDASGLFHVFSDRKCGVISSSFLAVSKAVQNKKINKTILLQKILIGFDLNNETIFDEIIRINWPFYPQGCSDIVFIKPLIEQPVNKCHESNRLECVNFYLTMLLNRFRLISKAFNERPIAIGLSGGYDSRLLFGLVSKTGFKIAPFSYSDSVHQMEIKSAKKIAESLSLTLREVKVRDPKSLTELEFLKNLNDSFYFYDGRFNSNMGGFHDIYTPGKRREVINNTIGELNGLGGEIFRNYQNLPPNGIHTDYWLLYRFVGPAGVVSFKDSKELFRFLTSIKTAISWAMGEKFKKEKITRKTTREFFSKIWVQGHIGMRVSVENQLSFFLTPFAEIDIQQLALDIDRFLGINGEFEALMMHQLSPVLSSIISSYGFSFDGLPFKYQVKYITRYFLPENFKLSFNLFKEKKSRFRSARVFKYLVKFELVREIKKIFDDLNLPVDMNFLLGLPQYTERIITLGYLLLKNRDGNI